MSPNYQTQPVRSHQACKRAAKLVALLLLAGVVVACLPRVFAPRAVLLNTYDNSVLYSKRPDSRAMAGSTTKILTLYTALWAVNVGWVSLTDEVAISARAQERTG